MSDTDDLPAGWRPDTEVDAGLVRRLLRDLPDELSDLRDLSIAHVAEGWDNSVWRVGDELAARVPRRPLAAPLVVQEARWADEVTAPLVQRGLAAPRTVHMAPPGRHHPHPWLLVTWVAGDLLEDVAVPERSPLLTSLVAALPALHRPAPPGAPLNPFRGPDLRNLPSPRAAVLSAAREHLGADTVDGLMSVHAAGVAAPPWPGPRVWCHGDLHPRNLLRTPDGRLGVIDLGDVTAGDPAVDLGVLWTTFADHHRRAALTGLSTAYDDHVWVRARAWAARFVVAVAGNAPGPFEAPLRHTVAQLL